MPYVSDGRPEVKRVVVVAALMAMCLASVTAFADKRNESQTRLLAGQVMDRADAPLSNAVVYLKNTKTLGVKTYITDTNGNYRFPELSPDVDYQVYAEYKGTKSDTKTLSSFDSRQRPTINLKVDAAK
jgi:protocatechuate 3,4-dioxygenase beta subunit